MPRAPQSVRGARFLHRHFSTFHAKPLSRSEISWEAVIFTVDELATIPLLAELGEKELEYFAGAVDDIHLTPGEYVGHEGDDRVLAIVVEGNTEVTKLGTALSR